VFASGAPKKSKHLSKLDDGLQTPYSAGSLI